LSFSLWGFAWHRFFTESLLLCNGQGLADTPLGQPLRRRSDLLGCLKQIPEVKNEKKKLRKGTKQKTAGEKKGFP